MNDASDSAGDIVFQSDRMLQQHTFRQLQQIARQPGQELTLPACRPARGSALALTGMKTARMMRTKCPEPDFRFYCCAFPGTGWCMYYCSIFSLKSSRSFSSSRNNFTIRSKSLPINFLESSACFQMISNGPSTSVERTSRSASRLRPKCSGRSRAGSRADHRDHRANVLWSRLTCIVLSACRHLHKGLVVVHRHKSLPVAGKDKAFAAPVSTLIVKVRLAPFIIRQAGPPGS